MLLIYIVTLTECIIGKKPQVHPTLPPLRSLPFARQVSQTHQLGDGPHFVQSPAPLQNLASHVLLPLHILLEPVQLLLLVLGGLRIVEYHLMVA